MEDIEHTELDMIEIYDDQQKEWRFHDEQGAAYKFYFPKEKFSFFLVKSKLQSSKTMQSDVFSRIFVFLNSCIFSRQIKVVN